MIKFADEPVSAGRAIPTGSNETLMSGGGERISQLSGDVEPAIAFGSDRH
jgi:hypothetical protein